MKNKPIDNRPLCVAFQGDIRAMQAVHAFLARTGNAGWIFDVIDRAERAGVHGAMELACAILDADKKISGHY